MKNSLLLVSSLLLSIIIKYYLIQFNRKSISYALFYKKKNEKSIKYYNFNLITKLYDVWKKLIFFKN
jgi:hypothetical protein